jgi:hypothetical protein
MTNLKYLLFLSLFILSCKSQDNNQITTFNIKELPKIAEVKISDLGFVDIEYIPLETNEQCMISGTNDLITGNELIVGERFYLVKYFKTILKFQTDGSFVARIGTVGRGPNEFLVAHDVDVDEKNQYIYLLSGWQKKFLVYSETGELIRTFQIPFYSNEFSFVENGILCYSENHMGNIDNSFNLVDTNGIIIKSYPNKYPFNINDAHNISHEILFYHFDKRLFKKEVYSDTVYFYENEDFKPHLVIQVGNKLITPKARSEFDGLYIAKNYIKPLNLFEFGDYVYYEFVYKFALPDDVLIFSFIGSKKNNFQVIINTGKGIINDLDGGPNILPKTIKDDSTIISLVDALQLKTHVASEDFKNSKPIYPEKKKELEKLANSLKETDNPVLMVVRLKK